MVSFLYVALCFFLSHSLIAMGASSSIARSYELLTGMTSCARNISLDDEGPNIAPSNISADGVICSGAILSLSPVDSRPSDTLAYVLQAVANTAGIQTAELFDPLICGAFVVRSRTRVYVVAPSTSDVPLSEVVLPVIGDLDLGEAFKFVRGQAYIIVGTECMYMATELIMPEEAMATDAPLDPTCFPADATVSLAGGETRRMDELHIGDEVNVGHGKTSPVFAWTHRDARHMSGSYIRILAGEKSLTVTPGHFVYANGQAVPAEKIRKGDTMSGADEGEVLVVSHVSRVSARGLYNPQTAHGDIVVNGFTVTTYTTAVTPNAAHALLAPVRAGYTAIRAVLPSDFFSA